MFGMLVVQMTSLEKDAPGGSALFRQRLSTLIEQMEADARTSEDRVRIAILTGESLGVDSALEKLSTHFCGGRRDQPGYSIDSVDLQGWPRRTQCRCNRGFDSPAWVPRPAGPGTRRSFRPGTAEDASIRSVLVHGEAECCGYWPDDRDGTVGCSTCPCLRVVRQRKAETVLCPGNFLRISFYRSVRFVSGALRGPCISASIHRFRQPPVELAGAVDSACGLDMDDAEGNDR